VECDSNEKQAFESSWHHCDKRLHPALNTTLRVVPVLGRVHQSTQWNTWAKALFWQLVLCVWTVCNICDLWKLPRKLRTKATIARPIKFMLIWTNRPLNFNRLAFDVHSSFFKWKWPGIVAKTLTFPKRCPMSTNLHFSREIASSQMGLLFEWSHTCNPTSNPVKLVSQFACMVWSRYKK